MGTGLDALKAMIRSEHDIPEPNPTESHAIMTSAKEDLIVIDVRSPLEWDAAHLPNSVHIDKGLIEVKIESMVPDKSQALLLYCGGGTRSLIAAANLKQMGYQNVSSMIGGFRGWCEAGLPIEGKD